MINILRDLLRNRKQRVVLNGQCQSWVDVRAGVPQRWILGPLLFLTCINDLSDGLKSECKLFADDTSLFSVVDDINTSASDINEDLEEIGNWNFKWKMNFNPDPAGANASNISSSILVRMLDECWMKIQMLHEIEFCIWVASSNTFHPT